MPLWYPLLSFILLYNTIMVKERGSNRFFSLGSPWKGLCSQPRMGYTRQSLWDYLLPLLTASANLRTMWSEGRENNHAIRLSSGESQLRSASAWIVAGLSTT